MDSHEVTVLDSFHTGSMSNLESVREDINVIKGSCNDCLDLDLEPEIIFHLGIPSSSPMYKENPFLAGEAINGMVAILELARRKGARKVVFASSSWVYNGISTPRREEAVFHLPERGRKIFRAPSVPLLGRTLRKKPPAYPSLISMTYLP